MSVVALMTLVKSGADFFLKRACGSPSGFIAFFTGFTDSLRVDLIVHAVFFCVFPFLWFSLPLSPIKFLMEWREWEVSNVVNYASSKVIPEKTNGRNAA